MAIGSTVFKADLQIADMSRHYYHDHSLTIAKHPSETDQRMMMRLLAFALYAEEGLQFCKGLSSDDEPALWQKSLSDEIELWIELGQPDERRIKKACGRAKKVVVICYSGNSAKIWWEQVTAKLSRFSNLTVINVTANDELNVEVFVKRTMQLQCTIEDNQAWLSDGEHSMEFELDTWQKSG